jgi:ABC-2 type transport system ATP-binding protein
VSGSICVEELVVDYPSDVGGDRVVAVNGVSFDVAAGTVCTLLGPNGAGKTSTVETLEGYRTASSGRVRVLGLDPVADHDALVERIGVMLQRNGVYVTMGPREVLRLFAAYYPRRALDPDVLLTRVGLDAVASTPWRRLSGGEQQRLSLALALVGRPEVVFLDEPTAGIDAQARRLVRELVRELATDGVTVLLTTHDLDEAQRVSDRIVIMDHGRIVADGTPESLLRTGDNAAIRFEARPGLDTEGLSTALGGRVEELRAGSYVAHVEPSPAQIAALTAWLAAHDVVLGDLRAGRQSLEDVFLRLTNGGGDAERAFDAAHQDPTAGNARQSAGRRGARRGRGQR